MIDRITSSIAVGVDKSTKKAADAIEKVSDRLVGQTNKAVDNAVLIRLNSAYAENYLQARNAQDSISYMQTRESSLGQLGSTLQDLRDVAMKMGNPVLNESDKEILSSEANGLLDEINGLASESKFNDHSLLADAGLDALGLSEFDIAAPDALTKIDYAVSKVTTKRAETGASIATLEARIDNLTNRNISLAEASENYSGSLIEDITEMNLAVTHMMTATKALDAVLDLNKEKVMSLVELMNPAKSEGEEKSSLSVKDDED